MSKQIIILLKNKIAELSVYEEIDAETLRNTLKEELQFYILNFIYNHTQYNSWIMYGGSALRIIHKLNRMSVDLDFEVSHKITENFLEKLKKEVTSYFVHTYGAENDFLTVKITAGRGLLLKFHLGSDLSLGHPSKQVHVKIDLNHFVPPKAVIERQPINHDQLSFVILTYNMGTLMASKIVAIFLRGIRGVGKETYEEKGRDIYDLLWYMRKKIVPNFDYMRAKNIDIQDPRTLFSKLTLQMNKVNDTNLKNDLSPLFVDTTFIKNWLQNWRESYFHLLEEYKIRTVKEFDHVRVLQDFDSDTFSFVYYYSTDDKEKITIMYTLTEYWIDFKEGDLTVKIDKKIEKNIVFEKNITNTNPTLQNKLKQYATLFHEKNEKYLQKTRHTIIGEKIPTKIIRMTAQNFNPKEEIILNKSTLLFCGLEDLVK